MSVSSVLCKVIHFTLSATTKKVAIKFAIIIHIIKRMTRYRHKNYSNRLPISRQRRGRNRGATHLSAASARDLRAYCHTPLHHDMEGETISRRNR